MRNGTWCRLLKNFHIVHSSSTTTGVDQVTTWFLWTHKPYTVFVGETVVSDGNVHILYSSNFTIQVLFESIYPSYLKPSRFIILKNIGVVKL